MAEPTLTPLHILQHPFPPSARARPCPGIPFAGTTFIKPSCPKQWDFRASMRRCCTGTLTGRSRSSPRRALHGSPTFRRSGCPCSQPPQLDTWAPRLRQLRRRSPECSPSSAPLPAHTTRSLPRAFKLLTRSSVVCVNMQDVP